MKAGGIIEDRDVGTRFGFVTGGTVSDWMNLKQHVGELNCS